MNKQTIGHCSICGGQVTVPSVWYGVVPPVPSCESCGAVARTGPRIEMQPRAKTVTTNGTAAPIWSWLPNSTSGFRVED
jgi:hypothetical protein